MEEEVARRENKSKRQEQYAPGEKETEAGERGRN